MKLKGSRISTEALVQEYTYFSSVLNDDKSTKMAQASAVNYFRRLFTEIPEPPGYFEDSLIDVFVGIVSDTEYTLDVRTDAAWAITNLLCSKRTPLTHIIIDKGTLDVFVWCIATAESKLRDQCIWGVGNVSADCPDCKEAVRATDVLDIMAKQMNAGEFHSIESTQCAIWCCLNILRGGNPSFKPKTTRLLITAVAKTMRRYEKESKILQESLETLSHLADDRTFPNFPHFWAEHIDAILNEPGLISVALEAISRRIPSIVSPALRLIGNIITGTDDQTERVVMREGFVQLISQCIDSSVSQVRRETAWILSNIASGPTHHVDLILTNPPLIVKLLHRLHRSEKRMQKEICWVFVNALSSLNITPRPAQMADFLGYGVLSIVDFASKSGIDTTLVSKTREVLSALLINHPEFWHVVEKAGVGSTPLLDLPRRKKRVADYVIYDEDAIEI